MKIEIDIADEKLHNLSKSAKDELAKVSKSYIEDVLDEASRIEESRRTTDSGPEVTAAIISDAVYYAKNVRVRKRKTKSRAILQIIGFIASSVAGGLFNVDKFNTVNYVILFLFVFLVAVVTNVYLVLNENNND